MRQAPATAPAAAWSPLGHRRFRILWLAFLGAQVVIWAQTVGAVAVIDGAGGSPALIAAIQTAISLPGVLLALFAGAVADVVDRRWMLVLAVASMVAATSALAALTVAGLVTPAIVLGATAVLGAGLAMFLPAFSAMVPDLVPRPMLVPAVAITGVTVNIARAAGPALAGAVIAVGSAGALFWLLSGVLAAVVVTLAVVGPASTRPARPERIPSAVRAGVRYVRHSAPLSRVILRTALFVGSGSALWGCSRSSRSGSSVTVPRASASFWASSALGRWRAPWSCRACGAGSSWTGSWPPAASCSHSSSRGSRWWGAVCSAWDCCSWPVRLGSPVLTGLLGAAQSVAATWVRGRALSAWLLIYQGGLALGSLLWGLLAESSLVLALLLPAGCLVLSAVMTRRLTVDVDELPAPEPSGSWDEPLTVEDVRDDEGPVLVTVEYDVAGGDVDAFVTAMLDVRAIRRRDGARNWHLYRDVALPGRVVESFTVASWGEHLRQHERPTTADLPIEQRARAFVYGYSVRHLVGLRPPAA